jgi:hypothetical protein
VPGKDGAKAALFRHGPAPRPRYVRTALNIRHSPQTLVGPFRAPLTDSCAARQTASPIANILTAQEQACFASSVAQKRPINDHFAVILEKSRVAVQAQNLCFKSPILRPLDSSRCGRRAAPELADCWRAVRVVKNSLLGPNGVSEWVWQAGASRETIGGGQPFSLSSKSCR